MDFKAIIEALVQFLTDFFAALGKFLNVDFSEDEVGDPSEAVSE